MTFLSKHPGFNDARFNAQQDGPVAQKSELVELAGNLGRPVWFSCQRRPRTKFIVRKSAGSGYYLRHIYGRKFVVLGLKLVLTFEEDLLFSRITRQREPAGFPI
jgi:hypothetical protein